MDTDEDDDDDKESEEEMVRTAFFAKLIVLTLHL